MQENETLDVDGLLLEAEEAVAEQEGAPVVEGPVVAAPRPVDQRDTVAILDFGSQYTQLIARRIRELGVYCELHPWDIGESDIRAFAPLGIVLSGSHWSCLDDGAPRIADVVFKLGVPVLGLCYGMQAMAHQIGGKVEPSDNRE